MNNDRRNEQVEMSGRAISAEILDRLVDGELGEAERRSVLRALEDRSGQWRDCALAFLESQAWQRHLQDASSAGTFLEKKTCLDGSAKEIGKVNSATATANAPPAFMRIPVGWGLAACAVLAFALGWSGDYLWQKSNSSQNPGPVVSSPPAEASQLAASDAWRDSAVPREVQAALKQLGAEVHKEWGLMPVKNASGNSALVPYQDIQIVPVRGPAY